MTGKYLDTTGLSYLWDKITAAFASKELLTGSINNKVDKISTSTDNAVVRFNGTSSAIQNSGVTINDSNQVTAAKFITSGGTNKQFVSGDGSLINQINTSLLVEPDFTQSGNTTMTMWPLVNTMAGNALVLLKASQIIIEQTIDGGETWTSGGYTDAQKQNLFLGTDALTSVAIPKIDGVRNKLCGVRITITGMNYNVPANTAETDKYQYWNSDYVVSTERYCSLNSVYLWVMSVNDRIRTRVYCASGNNPNNWVAADRGTNAFLSGWSGGDVITLTGKVFGGGTTQAGNYWNYRFVFFTDGADGGELATTSTTSGQAIYRIQGFGQNHWTNGNKLMAINHLYTWDTSQNAIFPAKITSTGFVKSGGTSSQFLKADGSVDNNTYLTTAPVTSVNGQTGAVNITIPTDVSDDLHQLESRVDEIEEVTAAALNDLNTSLNNKIDYDNLAYNVERYNYNPVTSSAVYTAILNVLNSIPTVPITSISVNGVTLTITNKNVDIQIPDSTIDVDSALDFESTNPVENQAIFSELYDYHGDNNGHEYVDLGLPSGTLWATVNIGATNPEDYGDYYAWGETEAKSNYSRSTYKYGSSTMTKYNSTDGLTELEPEDDVAHVLWGGDWRTPTSDLIQELIDNCTWTWGRFKGTKNYVYGYKVTKNGNSILLPAAGKFEAESVLNSGSRGEYLTSSLSENSSLYTTSLVFYNSFHGFISNYRYSGLSVRPVITPIKSLKFYTKEESDQRYGTGGTGSGTVTSVGLTMPSQFTVSGSPITTNGTLSVSLNSSYSIPTTTQVTTWNNKQDAISDLATIRSDASAGAAKVSNVQSDWNATSGLAQVLNKPTTLSGYGITDASISNNTVTLGSNSVTVPTTSDINTAIQTAIGTSSVTIYTGTTAPSSSQGSDGDIYIQTT